MRRNSSKRQSNSKNSFLIWWMNITFLHMSNHQSIDSLYLTSSLASNFLSDLAFQYALDHLRNIQTGMYQKRSRQKDSQYECYSKTFCKQKKKSIHVSPQKVRYLELLWLGYLFVDQSIVTKRGGKRVSYRRLFEGRICRLDRLPEFWRYYYGWGYAMHCLPCRALS